MNIRLGNKEIKTNTLIKAGIYEAEIGYVQEGEKAKVGSELLDTIVVGLKIQYEGEIQEKLKKLILTDRNNSELSALLEEFSYLVDDEDESIDLMDLVGQNCKVEVIHNISQRGNIFANIARIMSIDVVEGDVNIGNKS